MPAWLDLFWSFACSLSSVVKCVVPVTSGRSVAGTPHTPRGGSGTRVSPCVMDEEGGPIVSACRPRRNQAILRPTNKHSLARAVFLSHSRHPVAFSRVQAIVICWSSGSPCPPRAANANAAGVHLLLRSGEPTVPVRENSSSVVVHP
jgi:hypothetical protein